eukprot:COSAG02_NODE_3655_length_6410_cov_3.941531_1_plen_67_part_00
MLGGGIGEEREDVTPAPEEEEEGGEGTKVAIVVPEGVGSGDDILFTTPCGRELSVRVEAGLAHVIR